ncbi:MAG: hypothetical protein COA74_12110 [Gammaproteobacteria bacterium]|nr:MAG: hypothetical protein COA74_12110 [Gammaproteobacteria bacterium]
MIRTHRKEEILTAQEAAKRAGISRVVYDISGKPAATIE